MEPVIKNTKLSYEAYLELREKSDNILEYIDGIGYMSPSPSTKHQRISSKLHAKLYNILEGKSCEVFHAPFDILLKNDVKNQIKDKHRRNIFISSKDGCINRF